VLPRRRELLANGQLIKLGGRGFDVLMALIDARGEIVGRRTLMARVWPNRLIRIICNRRSGRCALLSAPSGS
jgi:DNA-binding winged helix-turn-helix (wHTH) protein